MRHVSAFSPAPAAPPRRHPLEWLHAAEAFLGLAIIGTFTRFALGAGAVWVYVRPGWGLISALWRWRFGLDLLITVALIRLPPLLPI